METTINDNAKNNTLIPIEQKEADIEIKRKSFNTKLGIIIAAISITILSAIIFAVYIHQTRQDTQVIKKESQAPIIVQDVKIEADSKFYTSEKLKITLSVPTKEVEITEREDQENDSGEVVVISHLPNVINNTGGDPDEGYVISLHRLSTTVRTLQEIAEVKSTSYRAVCPNTAIFKEIQDTTVEGISSKYFEINNCNGDYWVIYIPKFNSYYEIATFYKGDLGVKQKYKAEAQQIINSLKFFPEITTETNKDGTVKFTNTQYKFSFSHPNWDTSCCNLEGPNYKRSIKVGILAKKDSIQNATEFLGLGVFVDMKNEQETFENYLERQIKTLKDDYLIVTGKKAEEKVSEINIGNEKGFLIENVSWKNKNYLIAPLSNKNRILILVISKTEDTSFKQALNKILESFSFWE